MPLIVISLIILLSSSTFANQTPPQEIQSNINLSKEAVAKFKNLNDSMIGYNMEVKQTKTLCERIIDISENDCIGMATCSQFVRFSMRERISFCMNEFGRIKNNGEFIELKQTSFLVELTSAKYLNFPTLRISLKEEANHLQNSLKKTQKFLQLSNGIFRQKYFDLLNQEYLDISQKAEMKGKLKGRCIYLKQKVNDLELQYLLSVEQKDFGTWYLLLNRIRAYKQMADGLREKCPMNFQPADYSVLELKTQSFLEKIDKNQWMQESCEKVRKNPHYKDICDLKHINNDYFIHAMTGAKR